MHLCISGVCQYLVTQAFSQLVCDWQAAGGKGLDGEDGGLQQQVQDLSNLGATKIQLAHG